MWFPAEILVWNLNESCLPVLYENIEGNVGILPNFPNFIGIVLK